MCSICILFSILCMHFYLTFNTSYFDQFTEDENGKQCVAIENFPLHTTSKKDGKWRIDNEFVWFEQIGVISASDKKNGSTEV
jgi:hypothetical protein